MSRLMVLSALVGWCLWTYANNI